MSVHCHDGCGAEPPPDGRYRKVLWVALIVNAAMFLVEIAAGVGANSASLIADAIDFFGDAVNYGVSLFVLALAPVWRSRTALAKGITMAVYGCVVLGLTAYNFLQGKVPEAATMGLIGFLALVANTSVAVMLFRFRQGDANMESVWLCSRNDAIGNLAIMLAALGVFGTGSALPDLGVALVMVVLALWAAVTVIRRARIELNASEPLHRS